MKYQGVCGRRCLRIPLVTCQLTTRNLVQFVEVLVTHIFIRKFSKPRLTDPSDLGSASTL